MTNHDYSPSRFDLNLFCYQKRLELSDNEYKYLFRPDSQNKKSIVFNGEASISARLHKHYFKRQSQSKLNDQANSCNRFLCRQTQKSGNKNI